MKTCGTVGPEQEPFRAQHVRRLPGCPLAGVCGLGKVKENILVRRYCFPGVTVVREPGMGQYQLQVRHFFQQRLEVALLPNPAWMRGPAGPGKPLGHWSELHRSEVMPERVGLNADEPRHVPVFLELLDLVLPPLGFTKIHPRNLSGCCLTVLKTASLSGSFSSM